MIQGHTWTNLARGAPAIDVLNVLAVDAMVLGNHEFDVGPELLAADEAAIVNGGMIRTSLPKCPVQARAVLPFDNDPVAVRLTGRHLREVLEHGVSGLSFTYTRAAGSASC